MKALSVLVLLSGIACAHAQNVDDLPLNEVPAANGTSQTLALFVTGDGGWAALDRGVSARLAEQGIATVGLDARSYFWHQKTLDQTTRDVERVLRHYLHAWHRSQILLIGYSFGADVLPAVINRLPPDLRGRINALSLLGVESTMSLEVHIADWLPGVGSRGPPVAPELLALSKLPVQCIYGEGEHGSLCVMLPQGHHVTVERIGGGHHFGRDYTFLADRILAFAQAQH